MSTDARSCEVSELSPFLDVCDACYGIVWTAIDGVIYPKVTFGRHPFLSISIQYAFHPGQDCVGRVFDEGLTAGFTFAFLSDLSTVDNYHFSRSHIALASGIVSVLFICQSNGSVLELGFEDADVALAMLPFLQLRRAHKTWAFRHSGSSAKASLLPLDGQRPERQTVTGQGVFNAHNGESTYHDPGARPDLGGEAMSSDPNAQLPGGIVDDPPVWPTRGSVGHPISCGPACKYFRRAGSCRTGDQCDHCHLCKKRRKFHGRNKPRGVARGDGEQGPTETAEQTPSSGSGETQSTATPSLD